MFLNTDELKANLSNFYKDYGDNSDSVDFFMDMFKDIADGLEEYMESVKRNQVISSMESFRRFTFAAFNGHEGCYDIESILSSASNANYIGLTGDVNVKIKAWNETVSKQDKIKLLSKTGNYIRLSAKRDIDTAEPVIIELTLKNIHQATKVRNVDYFLDNNRIFFNGDFAKETVSNSKLIATDIFVDYNFPYNLVGKRIGIPYSTEISKPEYRDFIQMVAYVLVKGPTIKNLRDSFNILAGWEGSNIVDIISAKGARQDMWLNPTTAILSPFDFLVTIPAFAASTVGYVDGVLGPKDERLGVFSSFLDVVKPTDTNYILALSELVVETSNAIENLEGTLSVPVSDTQESGDSFMNVIKLSIVEEFSQGVLLRKISYDDDENYDTTGSYDKDALSDVGENRYGDTLQVNRIEYPEYPISFTATKDILSGRVKATFTDSAPDVVEYDIVRNGNVVATIPSNGDRATITWTDSELPSLGSGTYEYFAQSVYYINESKNVSRPSKKSIISK